TSSARPRSESGKVMPSVFAVFILSTRLARLVLCMRSLIIDEIDQVDVMSDLSSERDHSEEISAPGRAFRPVQTGGREALFSLAPLRTHRPPQRRQARSA